MLPLLAALILTGERPLPDKVVAFARSHVGQKVGDGQCSSLAAEALRHAGALPRWRRGGGWGEEVGSFRDVQPGDILQFEGAVFVRQRALEDGGFVVSTQTFPITRPSS